MARHRFAPALVALTGLALLLTLHGLGAKSFDFDEGASVAYAQLDASGVWRVVSRVDPNTGLYYALLHGWTQVFGDSEVAVRSLGAIAAGLAVPVVALLGARLFGRTAGLAAGVLLAVNAFFVQYAQWARGYGLVLLLVALSSYCFAAELQAPRRAHRIGWVLASALAVYAHYFSVLVLLVQLGTLVAVRRRAAVRREWLVPGAATAVLCLPAVVFAARAGSSTIGWIPAPDLGDLVTLPLGLEGGSVVATCTLIALAGYALVRARGDRERWRTGFVAAWFVVPVLLAFAISMVKSVFVSYYLIVTLPALAVLAGAGLARLPGRIPGLAVLAVVLALSAVRVADWYDAGSPEDYRGAAAEIAAAMRPTDAAVYLPHGAARAMEFYARRAAGFAPADLGPAASPTGSPARIWLVMRDAQTAQRRRLERTALRAYAPTAWHADTNRVSLVLYVRRPAGSP